MSKDRYKILIIASLEAQQLKLEYEKKLIEISNNITAGELSSRRFNLEDAKNAISELRGHDLIISKCEHVKSSAHFKDVQIYLHSDFENPSLEAMINILKEIKTAEIISQAATYN